MNYARWQDWPSYIKDKAKLVDFKLAKASYFDQRIKAIIAIAPDLTEKYILKFLESIF